MNITKIIDKIKDRRLTIRTKAVYYNGKIESYEYNTDILTFKSDVGLAYIDCEHIVAIEVRENNYTITTK